MSDVPPKGPIKGLPLPPAGPTGLPEVRTKLESLAESNLQANIDRARLCPKCNKPGRVVSNYNGVNVFCGPCKIHWGISNAPLQPESPQSMPRGLHKETYVEPDWTIAFDRDIGEGGSSS